MLEQTKPATDEYAVMIDTRDALDVGARRRAGGMGGLRRQLERPSEMKLASLAGGRDGRLVVVCRDLGALRSRRCSRRRCRRRSTTGRAHRPQLDGALPRT